MNRLPLLVSILLLSGCVENKPKADSVPDLGNSISKAQVYVEQATNHVELVKPHADATGNLHIGNTIADLKGATQQLDQAQTDAKALRTQVNALITQNTQQAQTITTYKARWVGDRTIFWVRWIIAGWIALGLTGIALQVFGGGLLGTVGTQILHFLPVSNLFAFAANFIASKRK